MIFVINVFLFFQAENNIPSRAQKTRIDLIKKIWYDFYVIWRKTHDKPRLLFLLRK